MVLPLALAMAVGLGLPALSTLQVPQAVPASHYDETLARACEASHRAAAAPAKAGDPDSRSQSPAWMQEHRAAVELCLRDGLRIMNAARAGS